MTSAPVLSPGAPWPVDESTLIEARRFIESCSGLRTVVACDSDVDGLSSAVIIERELSRRGAIVSVLPVRRGEHVHTSSMRTRILDLQPERLIVVDMGSRPHPIIPDLPTLVIDHHNASSGLPPGAVVVNGWDREPVVTSSVLTYLVAGSPPDGAWLAALGTIADLGSTKDVESILPLKAAATTWKKAVSLLNAARRAPEPKPELALALLGRARDAKEVVSGPHPETAVLEEMRRAVHAETDRCSRVAPKVLRGAAVIRFSSGAQVHPIVAIRWARRLHDRIVIAANDGYLPGRTNFAVRSAADVDLIGWLRNLPFAPQDSGEFGNGHRRATGGSLTQADFERLMDALA